MGISGVFKKNKHIFKFKTQTDYSKSRDVKSGLNLFDSEACICMFADDWFRTVDLWCR